MASLVLSGDTSGSITVSAPAVAGSNTQTLVATTGTLAPIVSGTAVTASGTSVDFTGIPSWVKRITVMFSGVSTNGTSIPQIQLGDSGGIETSGYLSICANVQTINNTTRATTATSGFIVQHGMAANCSISGAVVFSLLQSASWVVHGNLYDSVGGNGFAAVSGSKTLSDTLTQVRITTVNGTDTFDAGTINILYE